MSKCKSSNLDFTREELFVKDNFFCQAKWHISQIFVLLYIIDGYKWVMYAIIWLDKWHDLKCHKDGIWMEKLHGMMSTESTLFLVLEITVLCKCVGSVSIFNWYTPFIFSAKQIIFKCFVSWIWHTTLMKWTMHDRDWHNLKTEIKFNVKSGEYKTFVM